LSFTLGAVTSIGPAAVMIVRGSARPLRPPADDHARPVRRPARRCTRPFGLEGGRQHPAGTVEDDLIERRTHLSAALVIGHYSQHRRSFLAGAPTPVELVLVQRGRYVAPLNESPIHGFRSYLTFDRRVPLVEPPRRLKNAVTDD
jgi:hypothetical protein